MHRPCHKTHATEAAARPAFGTVLASQMAVANYKDGQWSEHEFCKYGPIEMSPAIHGLHYGSTCFEGFKAYRWADGSINVFRMDKHIARMQKSAECLVLPKPDPAQLATMVLGRHRPRARRSARGAGRAVPAPDAVRHRRLDRRRHVARDRGDAGRAREPGLGLLREGREAAAHLRRGEADAHLDADGPGQGRRQLRGGARPDARGAPAAPGRPGRVLPGRFGAGDRRRQFPADPRRQDPDAQPRHAVPARRHARLDPDDRAAARLSRSRSASSRWTRCSTG